MRRWSADGSVLPIFNGAPVTMTSWNGVVLGSTPTDTCVVSGLTLDFNNAPLDDTVNTNYYLDDKLGTAQVELSSGGWPLWQGQFTPFGAELPDGATSMHYKFTGKERDTESGLDYFGARYYASGLGRFMSPDWSSFAVAVPYASYADPQSLNLYAYVSNNPLRQRDPDGHHQECGPTSSSIDSKTGAMNVNANCHDVPDWWQFQGARRFLGRHKTAVKVTANVVMGVTAISGIFDAGASEAAIPGEIALEEALLTGSEEAIETGTNAVYQSVNEAGEVDYVGMTNNFARRAGEHAGNGLEIQEIPGLSNLSRADARAVEQVLIEEHGLAKNGGTLINQINSIAKSNPAYAQSIQRGIEILQKVGYPLK